MLCSHKKKYYKKCHSPNFNPVTDQPPPHCKCIVLYRTSTIFPHLLSQNIDRSFIVLIACPIPLPSFNFLTRFYWQKWLVDFSQASRIKHLAVELNFLRYTPYSIHSNAKTKKKKSNENHRHWWNCFDHISIGKLPMTRIRILDYPHWKFCFRIFVVVVRINLQ